jgi:hypothetical protein
MSKESDRVAAGFMRLSPSDRAEVVRAINEFQNADTTRRGELTVLHEKQAGIDTGPTGGGTCPCCGR